MDSQYIDECKKWCACDSDGVSDGDNSLKKGKREWTKLPNIIK